MFQINDLKNRDFLTEFLPPVIIKNYPELADLKLIKCHRDVLKAWPRYPASVVLKAELVFEDNDGGTLVKHFIVNGKESKNRQKDFDVLKYLRDNGFRANQFRAPRPVAYLPEEKILIYEASQGRTLRNILAENPERMGKCMYLAGKWLAKMHRVPPPADIEKQNEMLAKIVNPALREVKKRGEILDIDIEQIETKINTLLADIENKTGQEKTFVHGDFQIENIIINRYETVSVIDFEKSFSGSPAADLTSFILQLENILAHEEHKERFTHQQIEEWRASFFLGYRDHNNRHFNQISPQMPPFWQFYRLNILLYTLVVERDLKNIELTKKELEKFLKA